MKKTFIVTLLCMMHGALCMAQSDTLMVRINGMRCAECGHKVKNVLRKNPGVGALEFNYERRTAKMVANSNLPEKVKVAVHGKTYEVSISYGNEEKKPEVATKAGAGTAAEGEGVEILAPLEGKAYLVQSTSETPKKVGDYVNEGDVICYIEAMKVFNRIKAEKSGTITSICFASGDSVAEDDILMKIK